ncbi:MAG: molybdopterin-dependent oxidoreductase [Candidatus Limnocylindrales bacterium]
MARKEASRDDVRLGEAVDPTGSQRFRLAWPRLWPAALAGMLGAAASIATGELIAGLVRGAPSLVTEIGTLVIGLQPPGAKDLVVSLFGTNDKLALNVLIVAVALLLAAGAGVLAARSFVNGVAAFGVAGLLALWAASRDPLVSLGHAALAAAVAVAVGLLVLWWLLRLAQPAPAAARSRPRARGVPVHDDEWTRRRFLIASAGTLGGVIVAGAVGRSLLEDQHLGGVVSTSRLPAALQVVPPLTADQSLSRLGVTPLVVPSDQFYRIDTALLVPQVDVSNWHLEVKGMVDHPLTFTYDELLAMPLYEQYVTIACVSNRVGDKLVGNALWTGVRLKDVLARAGVQAGATQIVGRSVDDFTVGFPTAWAMAAERESLIAVGMNREALPAAHGFPARLIVPGLYGYVSATKWLSSIELTTREAVNGYWVPLGWAKDAPILTQSRIDLPVNGDDVAAGPYDVAGVAWAPDRGIRAVEVRIDDGPWQAARIGRPISKATWVQWLFTWTATAGSHAIEVRATDDTGEVQTDERTDPAPDGARGHHRISVNVS